MSSSIGGSILTFVRPIMANSLFVSQQFASYLFAVQFCTSVLSEGVDIAACNKVIRFDRVKNVIDNIQARGRLRYDSARDNFESYVIMKPIRLGNSKAEEEAMMTTRYIDQEMITYELIRRSAFRDISFKSTECNRFPDWPFSSVGII